MTVMLLRPLLNLAKALKPAIVNKMFIVYFFLTGVYFLLWEKRLQQEVKEISIFWEYMKSV